MYDTVIQFDSDLWPLFNGHDPALFHTADNRRPLRVHEKHVHLAATGRYPTLPPVGPYMMPRLADARTMFTAGVDLMRGGGKTPGPNHRRLETMGPAELWSLSRQLGRSIRDGTYRPGPDRRVKIPKEGLPGEYRTLTIQNVEDRIVGRAMVRICQPVVEPTFSPGSFGFRPKRGPLTALANAILMASQQRNWVWVSVDVKAAFDCIPFNRFIDVCRQHFPADIIELIRLTGFTGKKRGLRQGSPSSPLFANIFFDHFLDRPWACLHADLPLIRYADDLLMQCPNAEAAGSAHRELEQLAIAAGTPLKAAADRGISDLHDGQPVNWLGYRLQRCGDDLAIGITERAWDRLSWRLAKAHMSPAPPLRAAECVRGWLGYLGPCLPFEDAAAVVARVRRIAGELAFDEIGNKAELMSVWEKAHADWLWTYQRESELLPSRLHEIDAYRAKNSNAQVRR